MKTFKQISLLCLFWMIGLSVSAYHFSYKDNYGVTWYFNILSNPSNVEFTYQQGYIYVNSTLDLPGLVPYKGENLPIVGVGECAFSGSSYITKVYIRGSNATYLGRAAFANCTQLESIVFASNSEIRSIGEQAFEGCKSLQSIIIPNKVTSIGRWAFYGCTRLTSINIPNSVTSIGNLAFAGCPGLTSITVDNSNSTYDSRDNCNAIIETSTNTLLTGCKNTIIPNSVTSIGSYAFDVCTGLTSIEIPNSVTSIGSYAFQNCTELSDIYVDIANPSSCTYGTTPFTSVPITAKLHVPAGTTSLYQSTSPWSDFTNIVEKYVSSVSLDKTSATINMGNSLTLTATVLAENAENKSLIWSSTNTDVATVTNGVVTAKATGTTTIKALAADGSGKYAICSVTVPKKATSISLNKTSETIYINDNLQMTATVGPDDATDKSVTWSSNNTSVATVSSDGKVTGVGAGTATITAKTNDGTNLTAICDVEVLEARITKITFDIKSKEIHQYENFTITPTFTPDNASNKNLTWSSDDETVATVENGVVTGVGVGETTIMAVAQDGSNKFAFCSVTVLPNYAESISLDLTSKLLNPGETVTLKATVLPATTTDKSVTWTSADEKVATVAADGKVTAVGAGTTTITAKTNDGTNLSASCTISVTGNSTIVNSSNVTTYLDIKTGSTLTLTDGSIYNINIAEEVEGVNVEYNRVYKNTKWQPWFTPFDVAITSDMAADFEFAKFAGAFMDEEGVMYITVVKLNAGDVVKANIPYMVKALNTDGSTALTMTVPSTTVRKTVETECQMMQSSELNFKYCGIYNQKVSTTEDLGWYYYSANFTYSKCTKAGTKINPFRFVMYITERYDSPYGAYSPASEIKVLTIGEDDATAIEGTYNRSNLDNDAIYDLTGRKVGADFKGIVIKNGKKMLQK